METVSKKYRLLVTGLSSLRVVVEVTAKTLDEAIGTIGGNYLFVELQSITPIRKVGVR